MTSDVKGEVDDQSPPTLSMPSDEYLYETNAENALQTSTSRKILLEKENAAKGKHKTLLSIPDKLKISNVSLLSPSAMFCQIAKDKDQISRSVPSSTTSQGYVFKVRKIDWAALWKMSSTWIKNPVNMVLVLWIICVNISGAFLFLIMTGMLNNVLRNESERDFWFEVNNQILNALFTLMCLYQHPKRFYHLFLLCRWKPEDISAVRKIFCKNGTYKPNEWAHMMVVVLLLHVNCFGQYALCGLNLGYKKSNRPAVGVGICLFVTIAGAATAGLYSKFSPLGKDYSFECDMEAQDQTLGVVGSSKINGESIN
ncbi:hypothetical protein ACFE04_002499 [Oxalis oulophora]